MVTLIALDCHKRYSFACVETDAGQRIWEGRVAHEAGRIAAFLSGYPAGSPVAVETVGNWYWIVDEIERAGMRPRLVHAAKAKAMMATFNKTDTLDARGLNRLQRAGALPVVWIPSAAVRDRRELPRTRMVLARERTRLKNRIHAVLDRYGLREGLEECSDIFGVRVRGVLEALIDRLPEQTRGTTALLLAHLDQVEARVGQLEDRIRAVFGPRPEVRLLQTAPGIGLILATVIAAEMGDVGRFADGSRYAAYAGVVPRVHSSGGRTRHGRLRSDVNHYLKWAYIEAAQSAAMQRRRYPDRHVSRLYNRIRARRGGPTAIGAVARHLAEATYWMVRKGQAYTDRGLEAVSSKGV